MHYSLRELVYSFREQAMLKYDRFQLKLHPPQSIASITVVRSSALDWPCPTAVLLDC